MPEAYGFHAHVYYDATTLPQAQALCEQAASLFALRLGRLHRQPIGPHPDWSCQLAVRPEVFGQLVPWLALNRGELVVFIHPLTGNDLVDHRDFAIWMGAVRPLDLSCLSEQPTHYEL